MQALGRRFKPTHVGMGLLALGFAVAAVVDGDGKVGGSALHAAEYGTNYRLGPQDKIRVRVFEWRASRDEVFEWKALNDDFVVGPSGRLSIPLVGELKAGDATTADLAAEIGRRLKHRIGLSDVPDISVEVVQFRPFYIVGYLDHPGEYAFRPNLTLLQAVSLAGGSPHREMAMRPERELITTNSDVRMLSLDAQALLARKARLEATLSDAERMPIPVGLRGTGADTATIIQQETAIFEADRQAFAAQRSNFERIRKLLETEVTSLEAQLETHAKKTDLTAQELEDVSSLARRGLVTRTRTLTVQRNAYQLESDRQQLEMNLLKARQEIGRNDLALTEFISRRNNELTTQVRTTQRSFDETVNKLETAQSLLAETTHSMVLNASTGNEEAQFVTKYSILRSTPAGNVEFDATESTPVLPGDTIKVESRRSGGSPSLLVKASNRATPTP